VYVGFPLCRLIEELDLNTRLKNGYYLFTHLCLKAVLLHRVNKTPLICVAHAGEMK
jgi:hypothetical protein